MQPIWTKTPNRRRHIRTPEEDAEKWENAPDIRPLGLSVKRRRVKEKFDFSYFGVALFIVVILIAGIMVFYG